VFYARVTLTNNVRFDVTKGDCGASGVWRRARGGGAERVVWVAQHYAGTPPSVTSFARL